MATAPPIAPEPADHGGPRLPRDLERLYPFASQFVTVGGGADAGSSRGYRMHYVDEGTGPVVICLHGNPTWGFLFRGLIAALRHDFRVIVPDHVGCGLSDQPTDVFFTAADRIAHLEDLLTELGIDRFSLVMHDWGGPLGTGLAVRRPDAIDRLVYLNTMLGNPGLLPGMIRRAAAPFTGRLLTQETRQFVNLVTSQAAARCLPAEVKRGYHHPYRTRASRRAIWGFVRDIPFRPAHPTAATLEDMLSRLPTLAQKPVRIIWGMRDPCFHPEILRDVADRFPAADVIRIPTASHLVLEDAPDQATAAIVDFLGSASTTRDKPTTPPAPAVIRDATPVPAPARSPAGGLYEALRSAAAALPWAAAVTKVSFPRWGSQPRYDSIDFAALAARIDAYEHGLVATGLRAAERVIMLVTPGVDFLALSYAIMGRGGVPVFIDPGMGADAVVACMREAEPTGFIGVPKAHLLRLKAGDLFRSLRFCVVAGRMPLFGATRLRSLLRPAAGPPAAVPRQPADPALVAFTSGGTGRPKGVIFTNRMLTEQLAVFRGQFGFKAGEQDLPLLPVFSLFTAALGVGSIFPPLDPSHPLALVPAKIIRVMRDLGNQTSFGSPTLWSKLADYCRQTGTSLPQLRRVFMAGAPVSPATIDLVQTVCPRAESFTPYGATEALPVTIASPAEIRRQPVLAISGEQGTPVGRAIEGVSLRVVHPATGPLAPPLVDCPERVIGEIVVSGDTVSREYLSRPDATAASKVLDGDRLWHRMGDMGYLDADGQLYFCGRAAHVVTTPSRVFHSVPVENVFNRHAEVRRTALIGVDGMPALAVEPRTWPLRPEVRQRIAAELRRQAAADPVTAAITRFYFHRAFPVDARHNAKIFRDKLSAWAAGQQAVEIDASAAARTVPP